MCSSLRLRFSLGTNLSLCSSLRLSTSFSSSSSLTLKRGLAVVVHVLASHAATLDGLDLGSGTAVPGFQLCLGSSLRLSSSLCPLVLCNTLTLSSCGCSRFLLATNSLTLTLLLNRKSTVGVRLCCSGGGCFLLSLHGTLLLSHLPAGRLAALCTLDLDSGAILPCDATHLRDLILIVLRLVASVQV
jgi:hypothetical protein